MTNSTSSSCPECGKPLPEGKSLCPACLLAQAIASRTISDQAPANSPSTPLTPEEIADKFPAFEILECLGRGGMGAVYKARQKSLNRLVAIKILAPERERDARFASRFAREAELLAKLSHPHIVTIHDFGETGGLYYLVMEFINGVNLRDLLREGKMPPEQALAIVPPVCEALQYAHEQGIVHRDIKPENILLDRDGRVKIADFGIASLAGDAGDPSGTPAYMAPEQQSVVRIVDHRADIYALGVVLYEMLTGERPTALPVAPSRRIQIDVRLDEVVLRALAQQPELRFQTAGEFRTVVETLAHSQQAPAEFSWQQMRLHGVDYRSRRKFLGLPLVHICSGIDPGTGKRRIARGWIAVGDTAIGGFAMGGLAFGGIAIGGVAGGVLSFGGLALGILAFGGLSLGLLMAVGGLAVGGIAIGGMAIGYYANGGGAMGVHTMSAAARDPQAYRFFHPWALNLFKGMGLWMATGMILISSINFFAFWWAGQQMQKLQQKRNDKDDDPPSGPSGGAGDSGRFPFHRTLLHMLPVLILSIVWLTSGLEKGAVLILGVVLTASTILQMLGPRKVRMKRLIPLLIALTLLGLAPLLFIKRDKSGSINRPAADRDEAINHGRRAAAALMEFDSTYGKFPDASTAAAVKEATGTNLKLGSGSSNQLFRQLLVHGASEETFWAKGSHSPKRPDNICSSDDTALAAGECGFVYIAGLDSRCEPGTPVLIAPCAKGKHAFDPKAYGGKAVVILFGGSNQVSEIDENGHIKANGMDIFDPKQPFWGGKAPDVKWPE
ncbi:serine/threonine-protein kinase [Haloferula sp. BvORR071]|uniref:serine/threonine-protein kinase n=1 Tax=Haloferula sp. BvORR071 TaxID=1396141 RepID=UPI0006966C8F|nr:serine/threonine-protein kinase [Haloferula sp. BvORR071]